MTCSRFNVNPRKQGVYKVDSSDRFNHAICLRTLTDGKGLPSEGASNTTFLLAEWELAVVAERDTSRKDGAWNARQGLGSSTDSAESLDFGSGRR